MKTRDSRPQGWMSLGGWMARYAPEMRATSAVNRTAVSKASTAWGVAGNASEHEAIVDCASVSVVRESVMRHYRVPKIKRAPRGGSKGLFAVEFQSIQLRCIGIEHEHSYIG
jgi:hypothetical protein